MGNMNNPRFVAACILSLGTIAMGNAMDRDVQDGMTGENDGQEYTWEQAGKDSCSLYSVNGCGKQMKYRDVSYPTPNWNVVFPDKWNHVFHGTLNLLFCKWFL